MANTTQCMGNTIKKIGQYTLYTGVFGLFVMAVVGTFSIDLVFIAAMKKSAEENKPLEFVMTAWIWHCFSGSKDADPLVLLLVSPLTTAVAIGLSIACGVSWVGLYLAGGWAIAAGIILLGYALYDFGKWLSIDKPKAYSQSTHTCYRNAEGTPSAPPIKQSEFHRCGFFQQNFVPYAVAEPYFPPNPFLNWGENIRNEQPLAEAICFG